MATLQAPDLRERKRESQLNPTPIFDTLSRYQQTMALKGAIELDLFTAIAGGATTAADIAAQCQAGERGTRILCDYLTIQGFLRKAAEHYQLTPESAAFLNRNSPAYLGDMANFMASPQMIASFSDIAAVVRKGGAQREERGSRDGSQWVDFARWMMPAAQLVARLAVPMLNTTGPRRVLDVAAGAGIFGIEVARLNPDARLVALDAQPVLEVAAENARRAGGGDRYETLPGDVFELELGTGYDLILLSNFLHMFDAESDLRVLKKLRAALKPGGRLATVGFVPNEDRISPPQAASFSLVMLANTEAGEAYTLGELLNMLRQAGFGESQEYLLPPSPSTLIISEA